MPTTLRDIVPQAREISGDRCGLVDVDDSFLGWDEVERRVTRLAKHLVEAGVRPGNRVGILHPRSSSSFIAVHAVLAARAVMVPLDPLGPSHALRRVLDAVEPAAIIGATATLTGRIGDYLRDAPVVVINNGDGELLVGQGVDADRIIDFGAATADEPAIELEPCRPDDLAYIIFTSGSTGEPKGIMHTHASGLAYARGAYQVHGLAVDDRMAATSPLHFDISTFDLYSVPLAGATVISISEAEIRFPASLTRRIEQSRATLLFATPYQLLQMAKRGDLDNRDLSSLRQIAFGGEAFSPAALEELGQVLPPVEFLNSYGPAEVNGVTFHTWPPRPKGLTTVPIGRPFPGVEVQICDGDRVVTPGETGELLVKSESSMIGYWGRPDLDERIFTTIDGDRFYRTGDLAHVDRAGLLHFEGRQDNRIKVRGVRIELEEIERVLGDHPGVLHAVAGRVDEGDLQHIAAWLVPSEAAPVDPGALTTWCRDRLPANAVPTRFVTIDHVPTTATGKIDRATLRSAAVEPTRD